MNLKSQRGQSMVLTLVFLTVLLGMAAAVIDVGGWYRAHRQTQSTADATALAGAQALPHTGQRLDPRARLRQPERRRSQHG